MTRSPFEESEPAGLRPNGPRLKNRKAWIGFSLAGFGVAVAFLILRPGGSDSPTASSAGAISLDGSLQHVQIPDSDAYTLNTTGELTVEAWIRPRRFPPAQIVIAKGRRDVYEWELRFLDDKLNFFVANPRGLPNFTLTTSPPFPRKGPHHIAASIRHGIFARMFLDGKMVAESRRFTGGVVNGPAPLTVGIRESLGPFSGEVDELRIWNLTRTETDISAALGAPIAANTAGLVGYWRFNERSGTTAIDSSRTKNNGKLVNGPQRLKTDLITDTSK